MRAERSGGITEASTPPTAWVDRCCPLPLPEAQGILGRACRQSMKAAAQSARRRRNPARRRIDARQARRAQSDLKTTVSRYRSARRNHLAYPLGDFPPSSPRMMETEYAARRSRCWADRHGPAAPPAGARSHARRQIRYRATGEAFSGIAVRDASMIARRRAADARGSGSLMTDEQTHGAGDCANHGPEVVRLDPPMATRG